MWLERVFRTGTLLNTISFVDEILNTYPTHGLDL